MTASITKLPVKAKAKRKAPVERKAPLSAAAPAAPAAPAKPSKATKTQRAQGCTLYGLASVAMCLSLDHLATGIAASTQSAAWQGWALALCVDVGFAVTESMPFTCRAETLSDTRYARLGLTAAVYAASAYFNTLSFAHGAAISAQPIIMGCAVPALIGTFLHLANRCILGRSK